MEAASARALLAAFDTEDEQTATEWLRRAVTSSLGNPDLYQPRPDQRAFRAETSLPVPRVETDLVLVEGRMQGTVTNVSEERWRAVNVHAFVGYGPMTTSVEAVCVSYE